MTNRRLRKGLADMNKDFWDQSWGSIDPERISSYAERLDPAEDLIVGFLRDRDVKYVCDAGCGCGVYSLKLARFGFAVSGFDIAEDAVLLTKKLLSKNGFPAKSFKQADVLSTGYPSNLFDAVVARDVIDHMPIKQGVLAVKELLRIVRPGGCVLLTLDATDGEYESEPHETSIDGDFLFNRGKWNGMVFHPYSASDIKRLADGTGFKILPSNENGFTVALDAAE